MNSSLNVCLNLPIEFGFSTVLMVSRLRFHVTPPRQIWTGYALTLLALHECIRKDVSWSLVLLTQMPNVPRLIDLRRCVMVINLSPWSTLAMRRPPSLVV